MLQSPHLMNPLYKSTGCSGRLGLWMVEGVEEILGAGMLDGILSLNQLPVLLNPPDQIPLAVLSAFQAALAEAFDPAGANGILLQSGQAAFNHLLNSPERPDYLTSLEYRLLPTRKRLSVGLVELARWVQARSGCEVVVTANEAGWQWQMAVCPWRVSPADASCSFLMGCLQEYFYWASGGKFYAVSPVDTSWDCLLEITRKSLD